MSKPKKKRYSKYCCLYTCSNKSIKESEFVFFNVPKEVERRREWLKAIDREDLLDEKTNKAKFNYVCSAHFDDSAMISTTTVFTRLQSDAVPTKLLPHKPSKVKPSPKSKKGEVVVTYSHTQCQTEDDLLDESPHTVNTDPEPKPTIVFMNIEPDNAKSNQIANKLLYKNQTQNSVITAPTTSKKFPSNVTNNKTKSKTIAASTQTDSNESLKYAHRLINRKPSLSKEKQGLVRISTGKRKTKTNIEFVECKRPRYEDIVIKTETEVQSKKESVLSHFEDEVIQKIRKMVMWQSKIKKKFDGYRHDVQYKMFALNLYYSSPQAYCCFQKLLKLPSKSTLYKYKFAVPPKVDDSVFDNISLKMKSLPPSAKYCTICIGEMPLKTNLYYDIKKDEVVGFHNVDGTISPEVASKVYVIMLQGIYCKWKQPVTYALLGSSSHNALDAWITKVILKLFRAGVQVKAIVSEQGSYFDKYAKVIKKVTIDKPYFFIDEHKIFYIFDVTNLLTCVRDNLLTSDFHLKENRISWDYIKTLYGHQKENNLILIPKITKDHIEPNSFQNNSFIYVAQIFSNTMYAALETYIDFGKINKEAKGTAKFIKVMNDLFDLLNSDKMKSSKKYKCAFNMTGHQKTILLDAQHMFASIKSINRQTGEDNTKQIETFYNFQITIQSILQLFKDLKSEGFDYVFTRRLNEENLLLLFQSISQNFNSCSEPTPVKFSRAFSKLFHDYMLKNDDMNCEADIYEMLQRAEDIVDKVTHNPKDPGKASLVTLNGGKDYRIVLPDTDALTYVAAFLIYKCYQIHSNCKKFNKKHESSTNLDQINNTNYEAFNKNKSFYGYLKMPSQEILEYIEKLEACFVRNFQQILGEKSGSEIFKLLQKIQLPRFPCLCFPVDYLLRLFVRLRIFTTLKYNNRNFKFEKKSIKQHLKVKSL